MLKIDLLPRHFAVARINKVIIAGLIVVVLVVMAGWGFAVLATRSNIGKAETELAEIKVTADKVRALESETNQKQAELKPIADKVDFVEKADASGEQFWDRFHAINRFIYERAQVTRFSITPPDAVNFDVIVGDTTECARFVLDLIQCPMLTSVSVSGLPAGVSIEGAGGAGVAAFTPGAGMGAEEAEMMPEEEAMGAGRAGPTAVTAAGEIQLSVSAQLVQPVSEPSPLGPAAAAPTVPGAAGPEGEMGPMGEEEEQMAEEEEPA